MRPDVMVLVRKARADWLRAQCEVAYVRVLMAAQRYADALRREEKYSPDQPRVPAGNPDGGQWTDAGGGEQAGSDIASFQVAQGRAGQGRVSIRVGGLSFETTPLRAVLLSNATNAAEGAVARVREIDPSWRPAPSIRTPQSADEAIRQQQAIELEATARLRELARQGIGGNGGPSLNPPPIGSRGSREGPSTPGYERNISLGRPPPGLPDFLLRKPGEGRLTGDLEGLTKEERAFVDEMAALGNEVEVIGRGPERTPDFRLNGELHERKKLSGVVNETSDGISSAISNRVMNARGQAPNVIIDGRDQRGMTPEIAKRGIDRAYGKDKRSGAKIRSITVLTPNGPVYSPRRE